MNKTVEGGVKMRGREENTHVCHDNDTDKVDLDKERSRATRTRQR